MPERFSVGCCLLGRGVRVLSRACSFPKDSDPAKDSRADCVREFNECFSLTTIKVRIIDTVLYTLSVLSVKFIRILHQLRQQAVSFPCFLLAILYSMTYLTGLIYEYWV